MLDIPIWVCLCVYMWVSELSDSDRHRLWAAPTKGLRTQMKKTNQTGRKEGDFSPSSISSQACVLSDATFRLRPMIFNLGLKFALRATHGAPSGLRFQAERVGVIPGSLRFLTSEIRPHTSFAGSAACRQPLLWTCSASVTM